MPKQLIERSVNASCIENSPKYRILKGRWLEICIDIIILFFDYFDPSVVVQAYNGDRNGNESSSVVDESSPASMVADSAPVLLIKRLTRAINALISEFTPQLGVSLAQYFVVAQDLLNQHLEEDEYDIIARNLDARRLLSPEKTGADSHLKITIKLVFDKYIFFPFRSYI